MRRSVSWSGLTGRCAWFKSAWPAVSLELIVSLHGWLALGHKGYWHGVSYRRPLIARKVLNRQCCSNLVRSLGESIPGECSLGFEYRHDRVRSAFNLEVL